MLINPAVSNTFSRKEKYLGVKIYRLENTGIWQLLAGCSISLAGAVLSAVVAMFSFRIPFAATVMVIILSAAALIPVSAVGIYIDLMRPKLVWNNPQEAIKQNFNVVIAMLLGFVLVTIFGAVGYLITTFAENTFVVFGLMLIIILAFSYISILVLKKAAEGALRRIEV